MKIFLSALAIFFLFNLFITSSIATDSTRSSTPKKPSLENKIERLETREDKIATREAALKAKLATFRDKKKASAAARINENLTKANQTRATQMLNHLNKLSDILSRLETRLAAITGKDTSTAKTAIDSAKTAIATARQAVTAQAQNNYTITVTSESKIHQDAMTERESLHSSLKLTHDLVVAAGRAVATAISQTAQLGGIRNGQ